MLAKNTIKFIKSLQLKKFRDQEDLFIVEGKKSVLELLKSEYQVEKIYFTTAYKDFLPKTESLKSKLIPISANELTEISRIETNDAMLAIAKKKEPLAIEYHNISKVLVLDHIQDPGNLGTIIRTADWFGIKNVVCSKNSADFYNPKVIAASMGSFSRINIMYCDLLVELQKIKSFDFEIYGALLNGTDINLIKPKKKCAIIIGNESNGIEKKLMQSIDQPVKIANYGDAESLNAAVAAGIFMYEFAKK